MELGHGLYPFIRAKTQSPIANVRLVAWNSFKEFLNAVSIMLCKDGALAIWLTTVFCFFAYGPPLFICTIWQTARKIKFLIFRVQIKYYVK